MAEGYEVGFQEALEGSRVRARMGLASKSLGVENADMKIRIHATPRVVTPRLDDIEELRGKLQEMEQRALVAERMVEDIKNERLVDLTRKILSALVSKMLEDETVEVGAERSYDLFNTLTNYSDLGCGQHWIDSFREGVSALLEAVCTVENYTGDDDEKTVEECSQEEEYEDGEE